MSNPYVILIQCVTVLYLTSRVPGSKESAHHTVETIIKDIKLPTTTIGENSDGVAALNLRNMIEWMLGAGPDIIFDKEDILAKLRINLYDDVSFIDELEKAIEVEDNASKSQQRIASILSSLKFELSQQKVRNLILRVNHRINYSGSYVDHKEILKELQEDLAKCTATGEGEEHVGFIGRLNIEDDDGMVEVFNKAKETNSTEGVLKTGYVGFNRMTGVGGIRRGEMCNVGALTHHYKSGLLLDFTTQVPIFNVPWMWDKKKKPMVLRVSFENKLDQDLPIMYKSLIEEETGEKIDISEIDSERAAVYVRERLSVNGYTVGIECYDPNTFDIYDLLDLLQGYEAKGYEIHLLIVDYLELISKAKNSETRGDEAINNSFEMLRNHCFGRGIAVFTGHQLSTEAQQLAREGSPNFVKLVSEGGYYRNSKSLHTKLDLEVLAHIYKDDGVSYLTMARGKHRGGESTPFIHRSYFQQFHPVGGLHSDIEAKKPECHHGSISEYINSNSINDAVNSTTNEKVDLW